LLLAHVPPLKRVRDGGQVVDHQLEQLIVGIGLGVEQRAQRAFGVVEPVADGRTGAEPAGLPAGVAGIVPQQRGDGLTRVSAA
jgi:hypothetical protein